LYFCQSGLCFFICSLEFFKRKRFFFLNMTQACFVCRAFFDAIEVISQNISIGMLTQISHLLFRLSFGCEHVLHVEPRRLDRVWKCWVLMRRKNRRTGLKTFENNQLNSHVALIPGEITSMQSRFFHYCYWSYVIQC